MTDVKTDVVLYEVRDRIATLTLNRPDRLNAWTGGLARRYYSLLEDAAADPDVRVIVVTGAGRGWCAGADMDSLQGGGDSDDPGAVGLDRPIWFPTTIPKPIVAAINGACAGISRRRAGRPQPLPDRDLTCPPARRARDSSSRPGSPRDLGPGGVAP